jgi:nucleoside-diphosphate-sugar epimerase
LAVRSDDPLRDWTFTPDLAPALERLVSAAPADRPVHLGSPDVWRDGDLADLIASRFPGSTRMSVPPTGPVKPPMVPTDVPGLRDFDWTDPGTGLEALLAGEVAA